MTILIDEARWQHRDRLWCHLASDTSLDELHRFAESNGIPRRGFHGDHYDIPAEFRDGLIATGASEVESREMIRRLKAAGLRLSAGQRHAVTSAEARPTDRAGS